MASRNKTNNTLESILSKVQEIHDLLSKHLKPASPDEIESLLKTPNLSKMIEDAHNGGDRN
jgi:hypothetical protein